MNLVTRQRLHRLTMSAFLGLSSLLTSSTLHFDASAARTYSADSRVLFFGGMTSQQLSVPSRGSNFLVKKPRRKASGKKADIGWDFFGLIRDYERDVFVANVAKELERLLLEPTPATPAGRSLRNSKILKSGSE